MKKQLDASETAAFGFQGAIDQRSLLAVSTGLGVNADPLALDRYRAQSGAELDRLGRDEEVARLDHELTLARKRQELADLLAKEAADGAAEGSSAPAPATSSSASGSSARPTVSNAGAQALADRLKADGRAGLLTAPGLLELADKVKASPLDEFRDRLAYREEIRNEVLESQLDDAHDLSGRTLYRLNFDVTLRPTKENEARFAVVRVELEHGESPATLYRDWLARLNERLNDWVDSDLTDLRDCMQLAQSQGDDAVDMECRRRIRDFAAVTRESDAVGCLGSSSDQRDFDKLLYPSLSTKELVTDIERFVLPNQTVSNINERLRCFIQVQVRRDYFDAYGLSLYAIRPELPRNGARSFGPAKYDQNLEGEFQKRLSQVLPLAYGATPKESVQRISDVASRRSTAEFAATLATLTGSASLDATLSIIRDNQRLLQGILRKPLVVGFTDAGGQYRAESKPSSFGWVFGPKFALGKKAKATYSHIPVQNAVSATLAVPAWWSTARLRICRSWAVSAQPNGSREVCTYSEVSLPGQPDEIWNVIYPPNRRPTIRERIDPYDVVSGEPAALLISGSNLWRSTEVTLGGQRADRIRVLPHGGIIASFSKVEERPTIGEKPAPRSGVPVTVWTSEGSAFAGQATVHPPPKPSQPVAIKLALQTTRIVKEGRIALSLEQGAIPPGFTSATLGVRQVDRATGGSTPWRSAPMIESGKRIDADFKSDQMKDSKVGDELQVRMHIQLRPAASGSDIEVLVDRPVIYYPDEKAATIEVPESLDSKDPKFNLTFPAKADRAFPGFGKEAVVLFSIGSGKAERLEGDWDQAGDVWKFSGRVKGVNPNDVIKLALQPEVPGLQFQRSEVKVK